MALQKSTVVVLRRRTKNRQYVDDKLPFIRMGDEYSPPDSWVGVIALHVSWLTGYGGLVILGQTNKPDTD